jgi:hypothetical protein
MSEFAKSRKVTTDFVTSVLLLLSKNPALAGSIFVIFCMEYLLISREYYLFWNRTAIMDTLHEDINAFMNTLVPSVVIYKNSNG